MTRDGVWSVAARVCAAAGTFAVVAVASRTLVPTEFAVWAVLTTVSAPRCVHYLGVADAATSDLTSAVAVADDDGLARRSKPLVVIGSSSVGARVGAAGARRLFMIRGTISCPEEAHRSSLGPCSAGTHFAGDDRSLPVQWQP